MGMPTCRLDEVNPYVLSCAKDRKLPALYCTNWDTSSEDIRTAMKSGFCGIKPYLNNSPAYIPAGLKKNILARGSLLLISGGPMCRMILVTPFLS